MNKNSGDSSNDFNEMLNRFLENPEALQNIMKIAGSFKNSGDSEDDDEQDTVEVSADAEEDGEGEAVEAGAFSRGSRGGHSHKKPDNDNRLRLLKALKPYLGENRREKVDYIIKLLGLLQLADENGFGGLMNINK